MRRVGGLIDAVVSADNLRIAWLKAIRGKRMHSAVLRFRERLDENLRSIGADLTSGRYEWGEYRRFTIYDPKEREIKVAPFRDRIAYHALMNVCEARFDGVQYPSSCACRKGRGHFAALDIALHNSRARRYFLKNDVRKYFDSIPHDALKESILRLFKDKLVVQAFFGVIDSYSGAPERGLPIGSLTSQFFANHYLNVLDRAVYEELKIPCYVRYMDDFVLWSDSLEELRLARRRLVELADGRLKLELKPEVLNACRLGVEFLGFIVRPDGLSLTLRARKRYWRVYKKTLELYADGILSEDETACRILSATEYVKHARCNAFLSRAYKELGYGS